MRESQGGSPIGKALKTKADLSIFFLVGPMFSLSAGSSTVEYSDRALKDEQHYPGAVDIS